MASTIRDKARKRLRDIRQDKRSLSRLSGKTLAKLEGSSKERSVASAAAGARLQERLKDQAELAEDVGDVRRRRK